MYAKFEELKGKTITKIKGMKEDSVCVEFFCSDGCISRFTTCPLKECK